MITIELWIKEKWGEYHGFHIAETQSLPWILSFSMPNNLPFVLSDSFFALLQAQEADLYGFHQGVPLISDFPLGLGNDSSKKADSRKKVNQSVTPLAPLLMVAIIGCFLYWRPQFLLGSLIATVFSICSPATSPSLAPWNLGVTLPFGSFPPDGYRWYMLSRPSVLTFPHPRD